MQRTYSCRLPHSRMWAEAFAAAVDTPYESLPDVTRLTLQSHLYALTAAWLLRSKENETDGAKALRRLMERTYRLIGNRFNEPLNLEEMARESGVAASRFYQAFKEYTGFTPHKWITATRLNASLSLLSNSPASIMDVAHSVGYADELYFSRVFKKYMGLSPTEYVARANRRIANLCPVFEGDFKALGMTPAFSPPRGWTERWQELMPRLRDAQPDIIIFTQPVSEEILLELQHIAPVEMIIWKNSNLSWRDRLHRIGQLLELSGVADHWLTSGDEYSNIGTLKTPLFEDIAELDPDVIFISGRQSTFYEELKEIADVVFVGTQQNDYWNTFLASVDIAAKMFGKEAEAAEYLAKFDEALKNINTLAGNYETSLVTMYNEGNLSGFASNSRFGYMYEVYGFKPVTDDIEASSHGSNFGFEAVLEFNPEVLLVIDRTAATAGNTSNIEADMENAIIKKTKAYQNNRIVYLDGPLWYLGGGGLQSELAKIEEVLAELK